MSVRLRRMIVPVSLLGIIVGIHVVWYKIQYNEDFVSSADVHLPITLRIFENKQNENKDVKQNENKDLKQDKNKVVKQDENKDVKQS